MVKVETLDYKPKPIQENFMDDSKNYPVTGKHHDHEVRGEGIKRTDADGKPMPINLGIHGTKVAVDWDACVADGACMDVCPVSLYEWELNPGQMGTGNDKDISKDKALYAKYRTDKCDPIRESECIFCMACESVCPTRAIKITP